MSGRYYMIAHVLCFHDDSVNKAARTQRTGNSAPELTTTIDRL